MQAQNFKYNLQPKGVELSVQVVLQAEQDTLGRMWFATPMGIYYSDGIETFSLPDTVSREFNYRMSIHIDEDGIVWLYNSTGLPKIVKGGYGKWEFVELNVKFNEKYRSGINFFSLGKGVEKKFFLDTKYDLLQWDNAGGEKKLIERDFEKEGQIGSVESFAGRYYLMFENGVFSLDDSHLTPIDLEGIPLPSSPFLIKKNENDQLYYFLGREYLAVGKDPLHPVEIIDQNFSDLEYSSIDYYDLFFDQNAVFYHFNSQLFKYSKNYKFPLKIDLTNEMRVYSVNKAMMDREGILWIGTTRGLVNFHSLAFQNYGLGSSTLMSEEVSAIGNIGNGEYLFGFNNGIQKFSSLSVKTLLRDSYPEGNPENRIINFSNDGKGTVWFSSNWAGVGKYDIKSERIQLFAPPAGVNISHVKVEGDSLIITAPENLFISAISSPSSSLYKRDIRSDIEALLEGDVFYMRKVGKLSDGRLVIMKAN